MEFVIDPNTLTKCSIFSAHGKHLLKEYVKYVQTGGVKARVEKMIKESFDGKLKNVLNVLIRSDEPAGR